MKIRFELKEVLKFYYKKSGNSRKIPFTVLNGVNLKIYENKINAIVGKSGCGKSTLTRVLMGLEDYAAGEILYKGGKIESVPMKEFRKKNQVMFQNPLLSVNPYLKIKAIISEPLVIDGRDKRGIREKVAHLLDVLEIPHDFLDRYPGELSAGQLQRVVFARALVLDPEFIVLDEPFSSLDEIMAMRLIKYFKEVFTRLNMGVLYISHHLKRVQFFADTAALMEKGKISRHGVAKNFFCE
ncbi:MAG: ABC transporter ATP-binding protein [Candidatus Aminicenantes bacterium]|nr:ABC transporter ATP-binding protein [Candidatus Aminicenantes bacterium]